MESFCVNIMSYSPIPLNIRIFPPLFSMYVIYLFVCSSFVGSVLCLLYGRPMSVQMFDCILMVFHVYQMLPSIKKYKIKDHNFHKEVKKKKNV